MIGATTQPIETQKQVRVSLKDYLDILLPTNGRGSKSRRIQRFCEKYHFSQVEFEAITDKIGSSSFQVII